MSVLAIELNDAAVAAVAADGVRYSEPGFAIDLDNALLSGEAARKLRRLHPRRINFRFWSELSDSPLRQPVAGCETFADLVYAQLGQLWQESSAGIEQVLLAVPPGWSDEQLALLLGISDELEIPVAGMVHTGLAVATQPFPDGELFYLEATLHGCSVQHLNQSGGQVSLAEQVVLPGTGLHALEGAGLEYVARRLLECSRFDPMQDAGTEQALADKLPDWFRALQAGASDAGSEIELTHGSWSFEATLDAAALTVALQARFEPVLQRLRAMLPVDRPVALMVSDALSGFPGLVEQIAAETGADIFIQEPAAAARGALARAGGFALTPDAGFHFVQSLPWAGEPLAAATSGTAAAAINGTKPSHVLYGSSVYPLQEQAFLVGGELPDGVYGVQLPAAAGVSRHHFTIRSDAGGVLLEDHSRYGTVLNGHRIDGGVRLRAGDVITLGQPESRFELVSEVQPGTSDAGSGGD